MCVKSQEFEFCFGTGGTENKSKNHYDVMMMMMIMIPKGEKNVDDRRERKRGRRERCERETMEKKIRELPFLLSVVVSWGFHDFFAKKSGKATHFREQHIHTHTRR